MASATGIPQRPPADDDVAYEGEDREAEPLLGRRGDATQHEGQSFFKNPILGESSVGSSSVLFAFP
jgi:hypothetical protein